jgi:hypothetical protein
VCVIVFLGFQMFERENYISLVINSWCFVPLGSFGFYRCKNVIIVNVETEINEMV